jgi:hypothetical protein
MISRKWFFPSVLLAVGIVLTSTAGPIYSGSDTSLTGTQWDPLTTNPTFKIAMDAKSVKIVVVNDGFEIKTRLKMSFGQPIEVNGQKKLGAYYINDISAVCKDDKLKFDKSSVFAADGELLATGKNLGSLANPHSANNFVTVWMALSCNQVKNLKVPTII